MPLSLFFVNFQTRADELDDVIEDACKSLTEDECEDLKKEYKDQEKQFDTLENQLKNAKRLAELKKQQSKTLEGQIQILNLEITNVQGGISSLEKEIDATQENIDAIKEKIDTKNKNIEEYQKNLGEMMRNYYKLNQNLGLSLLSEDNGMSNVFTQSDYLSQVSTKINTFLNIIREEKASLSQERENIEIEKGKLDNKKFDLDQEKNTLAAKKSEKGSLLTRTKGEEAEYQALISKIESQMKQLLIDVNSLSVVEQRELNNILKDAKKPKEGTASTSWHYYQTDSRWKNERLGGSRYTIGDSGCAITSIAMVFTYHNEKVNPEKLADVSSFTNQGYIDWDSATKKFDMDLVEKTNHFSGSIDFDDLEDYIDDDRPVIVYIRAGSKYGPGHYVVVHGYDKKNKDFVVHDPYWGPNLLLETSKKLVSKLHGKSVVVDQMIVYK